MNVYGIKLLAGKNFQRHRGERHQQADHFERDGCKKVWMENSRKLPIGKPFKMGDQQGMITGVTNNFHYSSLQQPIEPLAIYPLQNHFSRLP
jgi:putative ABC transport system permease protein